MKEQMNYTAPEAHPVVFQAEGALLDLSNFGDPNAPGQAFDGGNIINNQLDF